MVSFQVDLEKSEGVTPQAAAVAAKISSHLIKYFSHAENIASREHIDPRETK